MLKFWLDCWNADVDICTLSVCICLSCFLQSTDVDLIGNAETGEGRWLGAFSKLGTCYIMTITLENSRNTFLKGPPPLHPYPLVIVFNVNVDLIGKADMGEGGDGRKATLISSSWDRKPSVHRQSRAWVCLFFCWFKSFCKSLVHREPELSLYFLLSM